MVQSGIAYAAGQLLAVVAPRTVLVVDAPTDWSLAGPLWELALDDAPVDEILDVLIRRGIRTAPSFAIVRVEADAVRALVRGSVPVCFERVGEPVRLDATGATTWLEGLISGARRVLVGSVESNTTLPFLVSTGVVLVSGLALPCEPAETDGRRSGGTAVPDSISTPEPSEPPSEPSEPDTFFSPPVPVGTGAGAFTPATGREPRVVDLTRSEPRSPARAFTSAPESPESRDSWALASNWANPVRPTERPAELPHSELNGHVPAVLEPQSGLEPQPVAEPDARSEPEVLVESETLAEPQSRAADPLLVEQLSPAEPLAPSESGSSSLFSPPPPFAPPSALDSPSPFEPPSYRAPTASPAPAPFESIPADDDPGELHDLDDSVPESAPAETAPESTREPEPAALAPDSLDDLLIEPADDEAPRGPAPTDLPNLDPPSLSLPLPAALNGFGAGVLVQPRGFGSAPAGWPPPSTEDQNPDRELVATPVDRSEGVSATDQDADPNRDQEDSSPDQEDSPVDAFARPAGQRSGLWPVPSTPDDETDVRSPAEAADAGSRTDARSEADQDQPPLGDLPLRVRGRSLRPEQSAPMNGRLLGGGPAGPPPLGPPPIPPLRGLRDVSDSGDQSVLPAGEPPAPAHTGPEPEAGAGPASGSLLLPAFFRGARAARKSGPIDVPPPDAREGDDEAAPSAPAPAPAPWPLNGSNAGAPPVWAPPVRRDQPERAGFNGGPPAMPGLLRPVTPGSGAPLNGVVMDDEQVELPTEHTPAPTETPAEGFEAQQSAEPVREAPRVLGVWCDAGHVTSPEREDCRVCGLTVPPQAPILVARPSLGVLIFDNGDRIDVDRPVVLGRDPKPVASPHPETPVLHPVTSATGQVSRTHAEVRASGWDVLLTDLDAMNGTALTLPGEAPVAIEPGVPTLLTPGARVDLGGETGFVYEVEG